MATKSPRQTHTHLPCGGLLLYRRSLTPDEQFGLIEQLDEDEAGDGRVRCPLCGWRPASSSRWVCDDCGHPEYFYNGCGCVWNTFDTGGLCPGCGHRWRWTSCLYCGGWSPHEEWYADDSGGP